jgi:glycosyltransferase involved in cell wall biosynthesis
VPESVGIHRARHWWHGLPGISQVPDERIGWLPGAVRMGHRIWSERGFDAILATGGPWTSFLVGSVLSRLTGTPLVLDYRDPWTNNPYRTGQSKARAAIERRLEASVISRASGVLLNTPELRAMFAERFAAVDSSRFVTVRNGFDPRVLPTFAAAPHRGPFTITHLGHIYRKRTPESFLQALRGLLDAGTLRRDAIAVNFVGTTDIDLKALVARLDLSDVVAVLDPVTHAEGLRILSRSDALLVIQAGSPLQVPAKIYEYAAFNKPILTLTGDGATANLVREFNLGPVCAPDRPDDIAPAIRRVADAGPRGVDTGTRDALRVDHVIRTLAEFLAVVVPRKAARGAR